MILCLFLSRADAADRKKLTIIWDGTNIQVADNNAREVIREFPKREPAAVLDCELLDMKKTCIQLYPQKRAEPYGTNLHFVRPIAILPEYYSAEDREKEAAAESQTAVPTARGAKPQKPFELSHLTTLQIAQVVNIYAILGQESQAHAFAIVSKVQDGEYALHLWKSLVGKFPDRTCDQADDYCSVVVNAKRDGNDALAYCTIANSRVGLGYPFNCSAVAFKKATDWYIYSLNGPEQCDGCGATSGASCDIETELSPAEVEPLFLKAMKLGKTNIDLVEISKNSDSIDLAGKKIATDSKFYAGYYEKSSANYQIYSTSNGDPDPEARRKFIVVAGIFVMLISAEPSKSAQDYREIGEIKWFQDQVLKIIKEQVGDKISKYVSCVTQPID
jgi:hypothetical protein